MMRFVLYTIWNDKLNWSTSGVLRKTHVEGQSVPYPLGKMLTTSHPGF